MRNVIMGLGFSGIAVILLASCAKVKQPGHDHHAGPAMNYHVIDDKLATSGHFVGNGLSHLAADGLQVVIDLRVEPPAGQEQKLSDLGIEWVSVPVDWNAPAAADFQRFTAAMNNYKADKLLVQCGANYRASAMTYLYQVMVDNVPEQTALQDLNAVWEPNKLWTDYIQDIKTQKY
ncbi:MAG: protein tyrosine phosphatase family protein [Gammaproteobacteria bacterium]|nr:protein tyrosine phosphatase family protein [Gammaproteobacteria bacterium]MDH3767204.1 protein tyrosine phosphatase family protein [Gammaproteobacteria bacterium]